MQIPLAPTAEQERIVAAIEEQISQVDAATVVLERVRRNLKRMRAAVLQAAVTGQLVPQELNVEPATTWLRAHKITINDQPSGLPPGWARATIGKLKTWSLYGPRFTSNDYVASGVPVLRTTDITPSGRILVDQAPKLALSDAELQKYRVMPGDVLITRTGSIGTVAFIREEAPAIPGAYLILYRFGLPIEFSEYLFFLLQTPRIQWEFVGKSAGIGRPNLNAPSIDATTVDIPPFAEVVRIVERVKQVLAAIERLEAELDAANARRRQLRASIFAAAFSGRLAAQDPMDESAPVLLERITVERAASDGEKSRRRITGSTPHRKVRA
jgi:restriction endonuclease S subunit